jgi:predicted CXXCH cytochrome family protein
MRNVNSAGYGTNENVRTTDVYNTALINHVLIDDGVYANNTNQNYYGGVTQFGQKNLWPYCGTQSLQTDGPGPLKKQIECSSCHNPHSEDYGQSTVNAETNGDYKYGNDYLRSSFYNESAGVAFCEYCHEEKSRLGAAGNTIGTGTHPVGTTANADRAPQADIHIESAERVALSAAGGNYIVSTVLYDMGIGTGVGASSRRATVDHGIGLHLTGYSTGGVTCQTCHRLHGAPRGVGNTWTRSSPANTQGSYDNANQRRLAASDDGDCNILAVENDANGGSTTNNVVDPTGAPATWTYPTGRYPASTTRSNDYNDLCVDCHETSPSVGRNWVLQDNNPGRTGPDPGVDPHPVNIAPDGVSESGFDLTVQDPTWTAKNANWTNARWAGGNGVVASGTYDGFTGAGRFRGAGLAAPTTRSEIVCLTCHAVHDGEPGTPILRAKTKNYCSDCHTFSIGDVSHPVGYGSAMQDNPDLTAWPNGDNLPLSDYYLGGSGTSFNRVKDNTVDMACFTCHGAHDGVDGFMLRITDDNSRICTGCHTDFAWAGGSPGENPSNYIMEYEDRDDASKDKPTPTLSKSALTRLGSHFTGTVTNTGGANSVTGETRWAFTGAWTDTYTGSATTTQTSHWTGSGSGYPRMQCQSCHTPHNAASGLVEANAYDGLTTPIDYDNGSTIVGTNINYSPVDAQNEVSVPGWVRTTKMAFTPTSALLLGNNARSKMCATCHWPRGTHVTTIYTVPAKPDPQRTSAGNVRRRRDYCTRIEKYVITLLNGEQEYQYNVYDLIADGTVTAPAGGTNDGVRTPESPCNFPPFKPGSVPGLSGNTENAILTTDGKPAEMLCDSCHAPHAAATGSGAFILEAGTGDASTKQFANQRVATRNYQALCWRCHDK